MTDAELISAIRTVVSEELKPVNARLDGNDTRIDKLEKAINNMNTKFSVELGTLRCQVSDLQKDVKFLKEHPYNVESRLSKVEQNQIELYSMINELNSKHA